MIIISKKNSNQDGCEIICILWKSFSEKKQGIVTIPKEIKGEPVLRVQKKALKHIKQNIRKIIILAPIKEIPNFLCEGSKILSEVILSKSIVSIGNYAFANCMSLNKISFENISSFGMGAFANSGLENIVISEDTIYVGHGCFQGCKKLKNVVWNSKYRIPFICFSDCESLSNIILPPVLESIENEAFLRTALKDIDASSIIFTYKTMNGFDVNYYAFGRYLYEY